MSAAEAELEIVSYNFVNGLIVVGDKSHLTYNAFQIVYLNLGEGLDKSRPMSCFIKNKYSTAFHKCNLYFKNNDSALIEIDGSLYPLIEAESFVIFDRCTRNAKVIGMGSTGNIGDFKLIDRAEEFRSSESEEEIKVSTRSGMFKF